MVEFLQQLINGLSLGAIYALIALGYTMVYGILKFINFAHSDIFALGVHLTITIAALFGISGAMIAEALTAAGASIPKCSQMKSSTRCSWYQSGTS